MSIDSEDEPKQLFEEEFRKRAMQYLVDECTPKEMTLTFDYDYNSDRVVLRSVRRDDGTYEFTMQLGTWRGADK